NQGDIGTGASTGEGGEHRLAPHHPPVEVMTRQAGSPHVVGRVEVIGAAFKDGNLQTSLTQGTRQTDHHAGLADSAGHAADDQTRYGDGVAHRRSTCALAVLKPLPLSGGEQKRGTLFSGAAEPATIKLWGVAQTATARAIATGDNCHPPDC